LIAYTYCIAHKDDLLKDVGDGTTRDLILASSAFANSLKAVGM